MKKIGQLLVKQKKDIRWDEKSIFYAFQRIVREEYGAQGVKNLLPDFFQRGKLFIRGMNSNWSNEAWVNREHLVRKLNQELGTEEGREIRLKS